jgi:hypothetical protein
MAARQVKFSEGMMFDELGIEEVIAPRS